MEIAAETRSRLRRSAWLVLAALVALLLVWGVVWWLVFRAEARGLAEGYVEAAMTAYQMDRYARPLPDRIFETGAYRVETKDVGTPPTLTVSVRDRWLNITHWSETRTFEGAGRPLPSPGPGGQSQ